MALYWRIGSLPELNHLSDEQRNLLYQQCVTWRTTAAMIAFGILVGLFGGGFIGGIFATWLTTTELKVAVAVGGFVIGFCVGYQIAMRTIRRQMRLAIVQGLRGERLPVCLFCGYDLTGAESDVCPECGRGIRVKKKPPRAK